MTTPSELLAIHTAIAQDGLYLSNNVIGLDLVDVISLSNKTYTINNTKMLAYVVLNLNCELYFPAGTYYLNSSLTFYYGVSFKLDKETEIIANANMDFMFNFTNSVIPSALSSFKKNQSIYGGCFNGDDKAKTVIRVNRFSNFPIHDTIIKNALERGIVSGSDGQPSSELLLDNVYFINENYLTGAIDNVTDNIAIELNTTDNYIHNCTIVDFSTGVKVTKGANYFDKIHYWTYQNNRIPYTLAYDITVDGWAKFSYCISDSAQTGFRIANESWLDHCTFLNSTYRYPYFVGTPVAIELVSGYTRIQVDNCLFDGGTLGLDIIKSFDAINAPIKGRLNNSVYYGTCTKKPEDQFMEFKSTFTPTVVGDVTAGTPTYVTQYGSYTRQGTVCIFNLRLKLTLDALIDGQFRIYGLPYMSTGDTSLIVGFHLGFGASYTGKIIAKFSANTDYIKLYYVNGTSIDLIPSDTLRSASLELEIAGTYLTLNTHPLLI
jgi:hypothetical protein